MILALAGVALFFFAILCGPNILIQAMAKHKAKTEGVEYEPICKQVKTKCPECGLMNDEELGFCPGCGNVFAREVTKEVPTGLAVRHPRYV